MTTAIILIGGEGLRFNSPIPKQFHRINNREIYLYTLDVFLSSHLFDQIVLVSHPDWVEKVQSQVDPTINVIAAGTTRQASSLRGLNAAPPTTRYVTIHDGVRPFVTHDILKKNLDAVKRHHAVDTCIPSADTIVYSPNQQQITAIPPRSHYLRGQTPQTFHYPLICRAHEQTKQHAATDDCSLILEQNHPVAIVLGNESNLKITTEIDLAYAEARLQKSLIPTITSLGNSDASK